MNYSHALFTPNVLDMRTDTFQKYTNVHNERYESLNTAVIQIIAQNVDMPLRKNSVLLTDELK